MDSQTLKDYATDAIRFWEPRRLIYNAALAAIVLFYFFKYYPGSKSEITLNAAQGIFILAVLANVAYAPLTSLTRKRICKDYATVTEAILGLKKHFLFYNAERQQQSLDYQTPKEVYEGRTSGGIKTLCAPLDLSSKRQWQLTWNN